MKPAKLFHMLLLLMTAALAGVETASAFYDGGLGRWINRDPIQEEGGLNLFGFVRNGPISHTDPYGHDDPGCNLPSWLLPGGANADCYLRCCAVHDHCFDTFNCTATSWLLIWCPFSSCGGCNRRVATCFLNCILGIDTAPGPMWYCANGPSAGTFYYNYEAIPADCWSDGVKPANP